MKKCDECGGKIANKKVDFFLFGENLGKFEAEVCTKCGEELFTEKVSDQIDEVAKKKGLWGLESKTTVGRVGNSFDIRISSKIAKHLNLKKGEIVTVHPEGRNKLVVLI